MFEAIYFFEAKEKVVFFLDSRSKDDYLRSKQI
jgi:hypothetical protein